MSLLHAVDPAYRTNARFMFADSVLKALKKLKVPNFSGQTDGSPLWQPGLVLGQPDTILGYPFVINQSMAAMAASAKSIIFGDLSKYLIRDVRDVTVLRPDERFAEYHQVAFLAFSRQDGDLLDSGTDPVKHPAQAFKGGGKRRGATGPSVLGRRGRSREAAGPDRPVEGLGHQGLAAP